MAAAKVKRWVGPAVVFGLIALTFVIAFGKGCDKPAGGNVQSVKIGGEWFHLEVAADNDTRMRGLGGRTHIEPNGGMLFLMPKADEVGFVMRDCPIPIDIIYLSPEGRIVSMYTMTPEEPRGPDEGPAGDYLGKHPGSAKYDARLKKWYSRYPTQFVIELAGGRIKSLKTPIKEGDKIDLPYADLKKRTR